MSERRRDTRSSNGEDEPIRERSRSPQQRDARGAKKKLKNLGIQMKLTPQKQENKPKVTVAAVFNQDSDEEPEEMPPQARMRMKNIGRDTPTSSGPNSFGKTKQGFSDSSKIFEKALNKSVDQK